jgi:predicted ATP-grasp superfamily ATP-dependent carboligase
MRDAPATAIVTDSLWRKSVSAIRSLGRAGYRVIALGDTRLTTGFYSRYAAKAMVGPVASRSERGFGEVLVRAVEAAGGARPVILPMEDESCMWLLQHGERVADRADWLLPSATAFATANDKAATSRLAVQLKVSCPVTLYPGSPAELIEMAQARPQVRWMAKPLRGKGSVGVLYEAALTAKAVGEHWKSHGPLLLQQRIPAEGQAVGVSLLYDRDGRCRAVFCHRRLRQYPVTGGPSTSRVSVAHEEVAGVVEQSRRLLEALGWRGVAMVEWKQDPATGEFMLIEINPRFWGSLELAVRSGVDFATLYARAAAGLGLPEAWPVYRNGVICRWMIPGELLRYAGESSAQREPIGAFLRGSLRNSEEVARDDLRGSIACFVCPALAAFNPRYWRYLRRAGAPPTS